MRVIRTEEITKNINDKVYSIKNIELCYGEFNKTISTEDLKLQIDSKAAINKALLIGKSEKIIIDNDILQVSFLSEWRTWRSFSAALIRT